METTEHVALVTGGGRGIGAAICRRLARAGHPVVVNYASNGGAARSVVDEIKSGGGAAVAIAADVADPSRVDELFAEAARLLGPPTILVNNAGVSTAASALRLTPEQWDHTIAVNLSGAFYCTHAALPAMVERRWGRVIFLGSPGGGRTISAGMSAYAAAKAGVAAMAKAIALETARRGITVNTVVPGFVETDMTRSNGDEVMARMEATWPKIPADAVASVVAFLVSAEADHVSGEDIAVWLGGPSPILSRPTGQLATPD
jgi:3-oxoacyl-[acyl-carrier protein] reductase